jgi:hypothetical protein
LSEPQVELTFTGSATFNGHERQALSIRVSTGDQLDKTSPERSARDRRE